MAGATTSSQSQNISGVRTTAPWNATLPALSNVLGAIGGLNNPLTQTQTQSDAFNGLLQNAYSGNPYSQGVGDLTNTLLNGGGSYLQPYLNMDTNPYNNPAFNAQLQTLTNDTTNNIKSQYAGAGYSPTSSGDYGVQLGRGIAQGIAPTAVQAQEYLNNLKMGAGQQQLSNELQGANLAPTALAMRDSPYMQLLNIASMINQTPIQQIAQQEGLITPLAQLGGTQNTQTMGTATNTPSLLSSIGTGIGDLSGLFGTGQAGLLGRLGAWGTGLANNNLLPLFNAGR